MNEITPAPERTVVVSPERTGLLWLFTGISLTLNVVILLLILVGAIIHHRDQRGQEDREQGFHHHGMGIGGRESRDFRGNRGNQGGRAGMGERREFDGGNGGNGGFGGMGGGNSGFRGGMGIGAGSGKAAADPAAMTDRILEHLTQTLTLTEDEKAKIRPIVLDQVTQTQKDMEAQRQAMQKRMEDAKAKIRPLLTSDQQKQLDALPVPGQGPVSAPATPDSKPAK